MMGPTYIMHWKNDSTYGGKDGIFTNWYNYVLSLCNIMDWKIEEEGFNIMLKKGFNIWIVTS